MHELEGVLHHEVNHVLFGHILHQPEPDEDRRARVIAQEVTCNEWVSEPLPGDPVLLDAFPFLPANEDTETRYDRLARRQDMLPQMQQVDDHDDWQEIRSDLDAGEFAVQQSVGMAWDDLTDAQRRRLDAALKALVGKLCGSGTDGSEEQLGQGQACVQWRSVLRRYVGRILSVRPVFGRPPRRFPHLVGVLPGRGRFRDKPRVMAVIDTSGSLSTDDLADISAELGHMAKAFAVTVVECDTTIHCIYSTAVPSRASVDAAEQT